MKRFTACLLIASLTVLWARTAQAQLEVTEVMFDANNDATWEWVEIHNTGGTPVDLDGAIMARLGTFILNNPNINQGTDRSMGQTENTTIPAGGTAVLYDAFYGNDSLNFDDQFFRQAWNLAPTVPVIGVSFFPFLTDPAGGFGIYTENNGMTAAQNYNADIVEGELTSYGNATVSLEWDTATGFPAGNGMSSMEYSGTGGFQNGANWSLSSAGTNGAVTSVAVTTSGGAINDADIGNPGLTLGTAPANTLVISEIMYNPASNDGSWEWVEVFNNTGATIDFGTTPYVFDDNDNDDLMEANVTSGSIPNGTAAILYDGDALSLAEIQGAWDPGGANGLNFIPVAEFTALTNGGTENGDTVAIWSSFADYTGEAMTGQGRSTANAAASVTYENDANGWPNDNNAASIHLLGLSSDPTIGSNWALSAVDDSFGTGPFSFQAAEVLGELSVHAGGDIGSPGTFSPGATVDVDLDDDGDVDGADFLLIQQSNPALIPDWVAQYPGAPLSGLAAVPEPTSIALIGLAIGFLPFARRR